MIPIIRNVLLLAILTLAISPMFGRDPLFGMTLHVVDDEGTAVSAAEARIGAERRSKRGETGTEGVFAEGLTDQLGYFSGQVEAWNAREAGYRVFKEGYYGVWLPYNAKAPVRGKWQPWNPTIEVVLKKKRNPVPMYARRIGTDLPVSLIDVGYDLVAGDWVTPYGKGKVADMIFNGSGEVKDNRNYHGELRVTFPGQGNGLIPHEISEPKISPLRMPYEAPPEGYASSLTWRSVRKVNEQAMKNEEYIDDSSETKNFFVRVRAETNTEGKVVKAMYGKIHAPFIFDARGSDPWGGTKKQYVAFTYYLNPDGTRNIEYDPKRNLLKAPTRDDSNFTSLEP